MTEKPEAKISMSILGKVALVITAHGDPEAVANLVDYFKECIDAYPDTRRLKNT